MPAEGDDPVALPFQTDPVERLPGRVREQAPAGQLTAFRTPVDLVQRGAKTGFRCRGELPRERGGGRQQLLHGR
ncbi:MAG: hypothetical protein CAPSK01_001055 [Candidatus Accumulibacter vicinus]|uniref:Uncharacterized protein n=1 Tax=Candidatus Accumulibacter vicinus TaxID=2954382 RepID=A0A084Y3L5_9PROT|nr:MAG: hypothetical protein CAPSK01_001055 [Candidatus Accumulibacter vicinus]